MTYAIKPPNERIFDVSADAENLRSKELLIDLTLNRDLRVVALPPLAPTVITPQVMQQSKIRHPCW